jgi:hypothetical protein
MRWVEDWSPRNLPLILLGIGAVTIFVLQKIVGISIPDVAKLDAHGAEEFRAFAVWGATYAGLIVAITWASIAAGRIAKQYLSTRGYRWTVILSAFLTVLVGAISRYQWDDRDLLAIVERSRSVPLRSITMIGNALAVGSAALVVGACVALATSSGTPAIPELRRRIAESRLLLFSAAVLLVVGVAEIHLVFRLPVAVAEPSAVVGGLKVLQLVTSSITLIAGLLYTSVLLLLFVPLAVVHENWIDEVWQTVVGQKHSKWLESTGLHRSIGSTTSQLIAAAAPLIAAIGLVPS